MNTQQPIIMHAGDCIYKYRIPTVGHEYQIMMPKGARIVNCEMQNDEVHFWAIVNPEQSEEMRRFIVIGTGQAWSMDRNKKYIGTVHAGLFVWHILED